MSIHSSLETSLIEIYRKLRKENTPEWAVHKITPGKTEEIVVPTIPFVGKHYGNQSKKLLVYASAENLTNHCFGKSTDRLWLDDDIQAENRHRKCFDDLGMQRRKKAEVIPYVHCGPMETGLLLVATMYIADRLNATNLSETSPRDFCERISFGNYGKYSKETPYQLSKRKNIDKNEAKKNIDYAGNAELMAVSHAYIKADIEVLNPDYIILPGSMYSTAKEFIDSIKGKATVIPIYQMLAGNVNNHIAPNDRNKKRYKKYSEDELHPSVRIAFNEMTTVDLKNYLYVFGYLDEVLDTIQTSV